jgi:hypothetical protein
MQNRGILIDVFASGPIRRETVFVDNMKIEAHAGGLGRAAADFQVTNA